MRKENISANGHLQLQSGSAEVHPAAMLLRLYIFPHRTRDVGSSHVSCLLPVPLTHPLEAELGSLVLLSLFRI